MSYQGILGSGFALKVQQKQRQKHFNRQDNAAHSTQKQKQNTAHSKQYTEKECHTQYTEKMKNNAAHSTQKKNALQANPGRSRTHPVFVEVLRCRQEFLQQGDDLDDFEMTKVLPRQHGRST